jgi:hypothetical protein
MWTVSGRHDSRVPDDVEAYLVETIAAQGRLGGSVVGAGAGGARGAARGARMMKTVVVERGGEIAGAARDVDARVAWACPRAGRLGAPSGITRWAIPIGSTGLQVIVVDVTTTAGPDGATVELRAYGKEGLLSRHPTEKLASELWAAVSNGEALNDPDPVVVESMSAAMDAFTAGIGSALGGLVVAWQTVWVVTEMSTASAGYYAYYMVPDDPMTVRSLLVSDAVQDAFRRLWESAREDTPASLWTTATLFVTRNPDGQASFRVDYGYDPVPIEAELARRQAWRTRYLPAGAQVVHEP